MRRSFVWLARAMLGPLLLVAASAGWQAGAYSAAPSQYDSEAAYLCNFGKFTHWPAEARRRPMYICILGKDPFGHAIDDIVSGEKIDGRPVLIDRLADDAGARNCSILFLGTANSDSAVDRVIASVAGEPVLTVSDSLGFLDRGGEIQFILENGRVRFAVNLNAVNRNRLTLESELLKLAVKVVGEPGLGNAR